MSSLSRCHSAAASLPPSSGLSPVSSSPPGSLWAGWSSGCSGPGSPPLRSGSAVPGPPPPPPSGSRGDGGTVPALLGDGRARWCAGAAGKLLWTGRWRTRTEGAPCRTKTGGSGSRLSQHDVWRGRGRGRIMRHWGPGYWHETSFYHPKLLPTRYKTHKLNSCLHLSEVTSLESNFRALGQCARSVMQCRTQHYVIWIICFNSWEEMGNITCSFSCWTIIFTTCCCSLSLIKWDRLSLFLDCGGARSSDYLFFVLPCVNLRPAATSYGQK